MVERGCRAARGFTLMEAVVAMFLSSILVALVTSVFLAQNRLYNDILTRSEVQEATRSVVDVIASELRSATQGAVIVADDRQVVIRTAQILGTVCEVTGSTAYAYMGLDGSEVDTSEVSGYGVLASDGGWAYYEDTWEDIFGASGSTAKNRCADAGADTTGAPDSDFWRLSGVGSTPSPAPVGGTVLMIYRDLEFKIQTSELNPAGLGLFRGVYGDTLVEFATGMQSDARFEYLLDGGTSYQTSVTGSNVNKIVTIKVVANMTEIEASPGDPDAYDYGIEVAVPLRNTQ